MKVQKTSSPNKLFKRTISQVINLSSSEDLKLSEESNNSMGRELKTQNRQEDFVCVENFNNFALLFLKLNLQSSFKKHYEQCLYLFELLLYKKERVSFFTHFYSDYSFNAHLMALNPDFKFDFPFQTLGKLKLMKLVQSFLGAIFNSCHALKSVEILNYIFYK